MSVFLPDTLRFLRAHFGLRCWLADPEGEDLLIEVRDISAGELRSVLHGYAGAIKREMRLEHLKPGWETWVHFRTR